jgi:LmbE family N-acetylglucosaminyl deacetylase
MTTRLQVPSELCCYVCSRVPNWLGGRGRWRDSGIPVGDHPDCPAAADQEQAVRALVDILRAERTR